MVQELENEDMVEGNEKFGGGKRKLEIWCEEKIGEEFGRNFVQGIQ